MEVRYPDGKIHIIDIRKVEEIEKDGTYLIHGREGGRSVILHMTRTITGSFMKIPHAGLDYVLLMAPTIRKKDVTKSILPILEGRKVESLKQNGSAISYLIPTKEPKYKYATASKGVVKVFVNELGTKFITYATAYNLGLERGLTREKFHEALASSPNTLDIPGHILSDEEFEYIDKNFEIEYIKLENKLERKKEEPTYSSPTFYREKKEEHKPSYVEQEVAKSFQELKGLLKNNKTDHGGYKNLILFLLRRNKDIMQLEPGASRDTLLLTVYHDLADMKDFAQGRYFPFRILSNFEKKINALIDYFNMENINGNMAITMLYNLLEVLQKKCDSGAKITFDDLYEMEVLFDGIIIQLTDKKKEEREASINNYLENNAHYNRAMRKLDVNTK